MPTFDEFVDLYRVRLGLADALNDSELHSSRTLMADYDGLVPDQWYSEAFDELKAQGHLHDGSGKTFGGGAHARLNADGRLYLRTEDE